MTNKQKLINLLHEQDGKVDAVQIKNFIDNSPLTHCKFFNRCNDFTTCKTCVAHWLNEECEDQDDDI